jgi:hypothetical protein
MKNDFMDEYITQFAVSAGKRALWTFAETALGMITVGQAFTEVNWLHIISVAGVAAIASLLKSIIISMPEMKEE